ncbi:oocyte zinc finger protein XlCOF26-like [Hypanus sabinus]|uniref:oocyte zinc finger protein XlCOF26-like n=1 Tax=Hypanus sabinus TaxID=79690 RepID=UPI0028C44DCB|nr:oocyte zinc finger protein XlCOF26-like [Hypanus sabinus]
MCRTPMRQTTALHFIFIGIAITVKNEKEFVSWKLKHDTPVLLSLSRYLRSGARDSIDHPSCSDCGDGFTRLTDQLACLSFYTGERPFTFSDSGNGFTRSSQLKVH